MQWMIYGATGYTGRLVLEAALKQGHRPIIAGRNVDKLQDLSEEFDLDYVAFRLEDMSTIGEAIGDMDLVYHAAGPFVDTSDLMIRACLASSTHYLDITGEISVFENTFKYDEIARKNGIALISGVGFDVVPSDCLAVYVAGQISGANQLETGILGFDELSIGTSKSFLELLATSSVTREHGQLLPQRLGAKARKISFPTGTYRAISIPWGDLSTAYRSTGIPNITTYFVLSPAIMALSQVTSSLGALLFKPRFMRQLAGGVLERLMNNPNEQRLAAGRSYLWARASNASGQVAEAWLETFEPYRFTAEIAVKAVERTLELKPFGALTPAQAFGTDFVLELSSSKRWDSLN